MPTEKVNLRETVERISCKYAVLVEERIDSTQNGLTGTDLREIYDGIQMLGHITATLEKLSRMEETQKNCKKVEKKYVETLMDGSKCELAFSIDAEWTDENIPEILGKFAQLSKSAYINLGNKMRYGTAGQDEIGQLAAE